MTINFNHFPIPGYKICRLPNQPHNNKYSNQAYLKI